MSRLLTIIVFALFTSLVFLAVELVTPAEFTWSGLYQALADRFTSDRTISIILLVVYCLLAGWVLLTFVRWIAEFAKDVVRLLAGRQRPEATPQTLDNTLIIDSPKLKRPLVRMMETMFSVAIWVFFIYLFQTVLSALMWVFGLDRIFNYGFSQTTIDGTMDAITFAVATAGSFLVVMVGWAQWNYWRFGRKNRRRTPAPVAVSEMATFFCLPLTLLQQIQSAKVAAIMPVDNGIEFREL